MRVFSGVVRAKVARSAALVRLKSSTSQGRSATDTDISRPRLPGESLRLDDLLDREAVRWISPPLVPFVPTRRPSHNSTNHDAKMGC